MQRIACLGDSSTFGLWLDGAADDLEQRWIRFEGYPQEFARLLAKRGVPGVEVVKAGVAGCTSSHGLRQLVTRVLPLAPHVVIARFGLNDHVVVSLRSGRRVAEPDTALGRELLYRFESWRLARLGLGAWRRSAWLRPEGPPVVWVDPQRFERNLRRFAELSRERGFHLLLVDYPLRPLAWGEHPHYAKVYRPADTRPSPGSIAGTPATRRSCGGWRGKRESLCSRPVVFSNAATIPFTASGTSCTPTPGVRRSWRAGTSTNWWPSAGSICRRPRLGRCPQAGRGSRRWSAGYGRVSGLESGGLVCRRGYGGQRR